MRALPQGLALQALGWSRPLGQLAVNIRSRTRKTIHLFSMEFQGDCQCHSHADLQLLLALVDWFHSSGLPVHVKTDLGRGNPLTLTGGQLDSFDKHSDAHGRGNSNNMPVLP